MQRPLAESGQESDGQQVEKPFEKPRETVFGRSMPAAAMANLDLADPEAPGVRQHRNEPVQLTVDADLTQHLAAIELETAIVVVQAAAGQAADHPVEDAAGIDLVPGIVAGLLPAADHVVPFLELGQEARNLGRVVLEVAVEREYQFAPGGLEPGREGRRLAEIAAEPDRAAPADRARPARSGPPTSRRGCRRRRK